MTDLSLHHLTMIEAHPVVLIEAAAWGGFSHCGIRLVAPRPGDPLVDVLAEPGGVSAMERQLRATGVRLLDIEAVWLSPGTRVVELLPALEVGARLGASYVLVVGNDDDPTRLQDNYAALCALTAPLGLVPTIEFITYSSVRSLPEAVALAKAAGYPNAGLLIDMLQFFRSGAQPRDATAITPGLLRYVQVCDGPLAAPSGIDGRRREARENRNLPGEGELPIAALLEALPPGLPLSLEAPGVALRGLSHREKGERAAASMLAFLQGVGRLQANDLAPARDRLSAQ